MLSSHLLKAADTESTWEVRIVQHQMKLVQLVKDSTDATDQTA